jgi:hypothetical protein
MNSGKSHFPYAVSKNQWCFYVNGYMEPYDVEAKWGNDWLAGGITVFTKEQELPFPMKHLLIEELEDFKSWLIKVNKGTPIPDSFDFVDADVFFKVIETKEGLILRLGLGYEGDNQIFIDTYVDQHPEFIPLQIARIESLLELFPCRCGLKHTMFSKQHLS